MTKRITVLLFGGLLSCIILSGCAWRSITEPRRVDPATEPTPVPTAVSISSATYTVQRGDIIREITLSGSIVPVTQLDLHFDEPGQVAAVNVRRGQEVAAGDILAELDVSALETDLVLANSSLEIAQAQLDAALTALANSRRRAEIAVAKIQITLDALIASADDPPTNDQSVQIQLLELDLELAQINLSELESGVDPVLTAAVAQSQLRVDELNSVIDASRIVAPTDGTVMRVNITTDQLITPADTAFLIADVNNLELRALVNDEDLALMLEGMTGISQRAGRPGPEVEAELTTLPASFGGDGSEENIVRFTLANQGTDYEVSDRANVVLIVGSVEDVIWLPPQAIREFRGRQFVVVEEGEGQRRIDIETGLANRERVEIVSGLEAGQTVVGE